MTGDLDAEPSSIEEAIVDQLDRADLRYTSGRRRLVETLRAERRPLALPELLDLVPDLKQSSAYRNLAQLEDVGVVRRLVHGDEHARYELAESLTEHHHHLICESCGDVRDVTLPPELEGRLDAAFDQLAAAEGFIIDSHTIDLFGHCTDCA